MNGNNGGNNNGTPQWPGQQPPQGPPVPPQPQYPVPPARPGPYQPGQYNPAPPAQPGQPQYGQPQYGQPQPGQPPYGQPQHQGNQYQPGQFSHPDDLMEETVHRYPEPVPQPAPVPPQKSSGGKTLAIVLGAVAALVIIALVVVFAWIVPSFTKTPVAAPTGTETAPAEEASPSEAAPSSTIPADAIPLPPGWAELEGPSNVPADGDPAFAKFVTGESSFQRLKSWSYDGTFGITKDPETGEEMQQVAQGTEEKDADGISLAFSFFAESKEGKYGKDPAKVKAAIKATQAKLAGMSAAELPKHLVGHKCASAFKSSKPAIREFRRGVAVVVLFSCKTAAGNDIQAVNLFSVTPWGTPQMMGVSGHKSYWDAHPGTFVKLGNSYRINKWKQG